MISEKVRKLCASQESVSTLLARDPTLAPGEAYKQLFGKHTDAEHGDKSTALRNRDQHTPDDLLYAEQCGKWGATQPSKLFLKVSL